VLLNEEKDKQELELAKSKKLKFKQILDSQINETKNKTHLNMDDKQYAEYILNDINKYREEENNKKEILKKKYQDELEIRKKQIDEKKRLLEQEREQLKRTEARNFSIIKEKFDKEVALTQKHKQLEYEYRLKMEQENEVHLKSYETKKKQESEEDFRLMQEYAAKLDREAADRENAFKKRMETMEAYGHKFETDGAGKAMREVQLRADQLLVKEQKLKAEREIAIEKKKEEDKRIRQQKAMNENYSQLIKRKEQNDKERNDDLLLASKFRSDVEDFKRSQEEKRKKELERQKQYREELNGQVEQSKRKGKDLNGITPVEKDFNMSTLRQIKEDPVLLTRVLEKARILKSAK
jgi:hypothetical protein